VAGGGFAKVRLPFPRVVTERKQVKEVLVRPFLLLKFLANWFLNIFE